MSDLRETMNLPNATDAEIAVLQFLVRELGGHAVTNISTTHGRRLGYSEGRRGTIIVADLIAAAGTPAGGKEAVACYHCDGLGGLGTNGGGVKLCHRCRGSGIAPSGGEEGRQRKRADHNAKLWHKADDRLRAEQKSHLDSATTAKTRIAKLEAALNEIYRNVGRWNSLQISSKIRAALASGNDGQ